MKLINSIYSNLYSLVALTIHYRSFKPYFCNHFTLNINQLIKNNCVLPHPIGIVIGAKVKIGNNCRIYQGVTIGTKDLFNTSFESDYPSIGDRVIICANCTIIGNISIGNDVIIGPNTYLDKSIPPGSIVYGQPLVIKPNKYINAY